MMKNVTTRFIWGVLGIMVALLVCAGCFMNAQAANTLGNLVDNESQNSLPEIYTAPIGGFNETTIVMNPNTVYTTNYTLYTRNWVGGNVTYKLYNKEGGEFVTDDQLQLSIEPSRFAAGSNQIYNSQLTLTTGPKFDKDYTLLFAVQLEGNAKHYANDTLWIRSEDASGLGGLAFDRMTIENQTLTMKRGERQNVKVTFMHGFTGIEEVTYGVSDTPLNVTVAPSSFIASKGEPVPYPAALVISADHAIRPGLYNFSLKANRTESIFFTGWGRNNEGVLELGHGYSSLIQEQYNFTVNVMDA